MILTTVDTLYWFLAFIFYEPLISILLRQSYQRKISNSSIGLNRRPCTYVCLLGIYYWKWLPFTFICLSVLKVNLWFKPRLTLFIDSQLLDFMSLCSPYFFVNLIKWISPIVLSASILVRARMCVFLWGYIVESGYLRGSFQDFEYRLIIK